MVRLTILRGISGSGKSTWARQQSALVVSRDSIRLAFFGSDGPDYYSADKDVLREREDIVTRIQDAAVCEGLKAGKDVIVDNTNTEWKFVKQLAKLGYRCGAEVSVKLFDVPLSTAIDRNFVRASRGGRDVDPAIIKKQYDRLQHSKSRELEPVHMPKPYHGTPNKPRAFMVDIDGTLAHMNDRRGPFDWKNVHLDDVDEVISELVHDLHARGYKVIIMSGRDGSSRALTLGWLDENAIWHDHLFMREAGDMRPDNIVKAELFDNHVRDNFDVQFVLDDRDQVVEMWRRMGLTCLQVAEGDF